MFGNDRWPLLIPCGVISETTGVGHFVVLGCSGVAIGGFQLYSSGCAINFVWELSLAFCLGFHVDPPRVLPGLSLRLCP